MKTRLVAVLAVSRGVARTSDDDGPIVLEDSVDPRLAEELPVGDTNEPGTGKDDDFRHKWGRRLLRDVQADPGPRATPARYSLARFADRYCAVRPIDSIFGHLLLK